MSHCVNYTLRDIVEHWPEEERGKITLLKDCSSSVPGFDSASDIFIGDMIEAGVNVETSDSRMRETQLCYEYREERNGQRFKTQNSESRRRLLLAMDLKLTEIRALPYCYGGVKCRSSNEYTRHSNTK
eukprot:scaffold2849_cov203-Alexandrium_tamarense.AAC.2